FRREDKWTSLVGEGRLGCGPLPGGDAANLEELEPERLDALERAVQGGLVGDVAQDPRVGGRTDRGHAVEGGDERVAQAASDRDLVGGGLHGTAECRSPV